MNRHATERRHGWRPTKPTPADVSGDGKVTSIDALMIMQAAAGSIELWPSGCKDTSVKRIKFHDMEKETKKIRDIRIRFKLEGN